MMDKSFGLILAVIALVAGIMLLTGHGDILLKGGNAKLRKEKYDEKKMEMLTNGIVTMCVNRRKLFCKPICICKNE